MSTLTTVEQNTPATPVATNQVQYPKVGGQFIMTSDGIEKQILDSRSMAQYHATIEMTLMNIGGF